MRASTVPVCCAHTCPIAGRLGIKSFTSAHHVKACRWSARSGTLEATAALAVDCICVRSPVPFVVAIEVAISAARTHVLASKGDWAALAVLEHAYAAAAGRRDLHVHALWREAAAVAIPGACDLFRREQLSVFFVRSLLSLTHGRGVNLVVLQEGSVWRIPRLLQSRPACCRVDRLRRSGCSLGCYSFCQIWVYLE